MHSRSRLNASIVIAAIAVSSVARAEPNDLERARTLFDEAGELERQGRWAAAQDRLRAALRIRETPHLRYALGWALENGNHLIEARTEYEVALRLGQRAGIEEVSRLASTRIAEVDRKTPLLQIRVRGALLPSTHVIVDGREVIVHGEIGTMPVDPGPCSLRIERSGKSPQDELVTMQPGVFRVFEMQGDDGAVAGFENDRGRFAAQRRSSSALPWIIVGAGSALTLSAVFLFASSASDAAARDDNTRRWCDATACTGGTTATLTETPGAAALRREAYDAASRGNTKQVVGAILGGIGVAGIAAGTYMLLTNHERKDTPPQASRTRLRADLAPLPGGAIGGASLAF